MADTAVQIAIELLTPLITAEISLISSLPEDVRAIKNELESISAVLERAEDKAVIDAGKKAWVKQVRTLAYDIEDVIEEYHLFLKKPKVGKYADYILLRVRNMAGIIKSIRQRAVDIGKARDSYRFRDSNQSASISSSSLYTQSISPTVVIVPESELVGTRKSKTEIIQLLSSNKMVAVVGMRGLGKTTVVRCVYNDTMIRGKFPICGWISARRTQGSDILRSMMKQFYEADMDGVSRVAHFQNWSRTNYVSQIDSIDHSSLQDLVRRYLKDKRYLLVFDNIKEGYLEKAPYVKFLLSNNNTNSKILVTTRNEKVAHDWLDGSSQSIYKLKGLPDERAWELFCNKTFQRRHKGRCPPHLQELARGIVQSCKGLPPALLAMGRLLSTKLDDLHEWQKVYNSLGYYLKNNHHLTGIYEILISNYNDLPYNLKSCFLYFGLFPKGDPINIMKLIRLWIAEGFIITKDRSNLTLEEIAEENLNELVSMSLVVEQRDSTERRKTLSIHEFLHEIILSKVHELNFCQILSEKYSSTVDEKPRRLSIHKDHRSDASELFLEGIAKSKSSIRSLAVFIEPTQGLSISSRVLRTEFLKSVHLLKVLDLCNAPIDEIPKQVGKLRNLRYLSLRNTRVQYLPSSISNLQDLQTLDLKQTLILELPFEINELHKLRHLLTYSYKTDYAFSSHIQKTAGIKLPAGALGKFEELQKLAFVDMSRHGTNLTADLKNLQQLRRLGIIGLEMKDGKHLCSAIERMIYIESLNVCSIDNKTQMIDLNHFQSPPSTLKRLYLNGPLRSFPKWILGLQSLVKLRLRWSNIHEFESLENLHTLPNLVEFYLLEACHGIFLEFSNKGFKRLKILRLLDLHGLESLLIHEGALPLLEELFIGKSSQLQVPYGIKHLRRLKTLSFFSMPRCFTDSIQPGAQHYSIVQHVPGVFFNYLVNGRWETYTLPPSNR